MKKFSKLIRSKEDWKALDEIVVGALGKYGEFLVIMSRAQRSLDQNALLHRIIDQATDFYNEAGWPCDKEGVKKLLKEKFGLWDKVHRPDGLIERELRSTASYDIEEMRAFIEKIIFFFEKDYGLEFDPEVKAFINKEEVK